MGKTTKFPRRGWPITRANNRPWLNGRNLRKLLADRQTAPKVGNARDGEESPQAHARSMTAQNTKGTSCLISVMGSAKRPTSPEGHSRNLSAQAKTSTQSKSQKQEKQDGAEPRRATAARVKSQRTSVTTFIKGAMRGDETVEGRQAVFCNAKAWHGLGRSWQLCRAVRVLKRRVSLWSSWLELESVRRAIFWRSHPTAPCPPQNPFQHRRQHATLHHKQRVPMPDRAWSYRPIRRAEQAWRPSPRPPRESAKSFRPAPPRSKAIIKTVKARC